MTPLVIEGGWAFATDGAAIRERGLWDGFDHARHLRLQLRRGRAAVGEGSSSTRRGVDGYATAVPS